MMSGADSSLHSQRNCDRNIEMALGRKKIDFFSFFLDGVSFAYKTNPLD